MDQIRHGIKAILDRVEIRATASSQFSKELVEKQLARQDLPSDQREYLEKLMEKKYANPSPIGHS